MSASTVTMPDVSTPSTRVHATSGDAHQLYPAVGQAMAPSLGVISFMAQTNLAVAVLFRQQYLLNALAWLVTGPPTSWPLRVRWTLGKYYHFGGLHVGVAGVGEASYAHVLLGTTIATTVTVMVVMALRHLRAAQHDRFEATHRFCGWAALVLVWINTMLFVDGDRGDRSFGSALLAAPSFWLVVLSALLAIWPWLLLRRVPIGCQRPSSHAVVLRLDHGSGPRHRHHQADQPSTVRGLASLRQCACRAGHDRLSLVGLARR